MNDTTISLALIISIISVIGVIYSIYNGVRKSRQNDARKEIETEKNFATINLKLDNLSSKIEEIGENTKVVNANIQRVNEILAHQEEQIKTLFQRVEAIEKGV